MGRTFLSIFLFLSTCLKKTDYKYKYKWLEGYPQHWRTGEESPLILLLLLHELRAAQVLEVMHKSVLPKDIKMPVATLAYPQYTYQQMRWRGSIPGSS